MRKIHELKARAGFFRFRTHNKIRREFFRNKKNHGIIYYNQYSKKYMSL